MCVGEADNDISILCAGQVTKNVWMDGSAEPRYQMGHMKQNKTYSDIFKLKNVCVYVKQVNWLKGN